MKPQENPALATQQQPRDKRQMFFEKYGGAPLASIFRNPRMTPVMLFILALAPLVIAAVVLGLMLYSQPSLTN